MEADAQPRHLFDQAAAARRSGDLAAARAAYAEAFDVARRVHDVDAMTEAALGLAAGQAWGMLPGRVPAFLHEAYQLATGTGRARLAVALARAWVYAGHPARAESFVEEAVTAAEALGEPGLLAEALDAHLLVHWGPDDFEERLRLTARLEDTVAHLGDVEARLTAYVWRLTSALENLDLVCVQRQLRALDLLAEESRSPRVQFFAASRRGMFALLAGDTAGAERWRAEMGRAGTEAGEGDAFALDHTLAAGIARQNGSAMALAHEAEIFEEYGTREGAPAVTAQAALFWFEAGVPERAATLLHQVAGRDFSHLVRDVEWLLTVTSLAEVAAGTGAQELAAQAVDLLEPYAGRAVVNAGAVAFEGVVEEYLALACASLGRTEEAARWRDAARVAYARLDAPWWLARLDEPRRAMTTNSIPTFHLRPAGNRIWMIGADGSVAVRDIKGLAYLRMLLANPGLPITALDLSASAAGHAGARVDEADHGELIDRRALGEYRRRLAEIDEELDEAQRWSDGARAAALAVERDVLLDEVSAATGLGGRLRRGGASAERARVAVRKAIAAAIARIEETDPSTGRVLRDTVHTGSACTYTPDRDRPISWVLD